MTLILYLSAYSIIQCLILALRFFLQKSRQFRTMLFAILLLIIALDLSNSMLYYSGSIFDYPHFLRIQTPLPFFYGPLLFFLIRSFRGKSNFLKGDFLHLIPALLIVISLLPIYSLELAEKVSYLQTMFDGGHSDSLLYGFIRRAHIFIYLILSFYELKSITQDQSLALKICLAFLILWLISMYRYFFDFNVITAVFDMIYINILVIYLSYKFSIEIKEKKKMSSDEFVELELIMTQIEDYFKIEEAYKDNLISVKSLAQHLKQPHQKISKAINHVQKMHFFDYLNQIRIDAAKILLLKNPKMKIEDIAMSVGYNSISVFNTAFKKLTNQSPREFRKLSTS